MHDEGVRMYWNVLTPRTNLQLKAPDDCPMGELLLFINERLYLDTFRPFLTPCISHR